MMRMHMAPTIAALIVWSRGMVSENINSLDIGRIPIAAMAIETNPKTTGTGVAMALTNQLDTRVAVSRHREGHCPIFSGIAPFHDDPDAVDPSIIPETLLEFSRYSNNIRNPSNAAADNVAALATCDALQSFNASGNNSAKTIQIMHPAANPNAIGKRDSNIFTKMYEGTAMRGWGRHVRMLQRRASGADAPWDTRTAALAIPSGILCTPIANVVRIPCDNPFSPQKLTPTPHPSPIAWAAIIPTMSIKRFARFPCKCPK
mmetsp:Transcript_6973/g.13891  ORF Transcript_6973/g.13891 Transcript_6973/m.13891 type:complete len:260 (+) Transcript_6973:155-934(+)